MTDGERQLTRPLDAVLERNPKRGRRSDGEYEVPNTTAAPQGNSPNIGGGGAASIQTAIEEEKNVQATAAFWALMQATHGFQTRAGAETSALRTVTGTPSSHHDEESITFYDSSAKPKRRPSSSTRKRMKDHPP